MRHKMKNITIILVTVVLNSLISITANATDWNQQQINQLQGGIQRLSSQIAQEQADIDARYRNMKEVSLDEALGHRAGAAEKLRHNAELQRAIQAAQERIQRYEGQIADNRAAIEGYRQAQWREQEKARRDRLRFNW
jgi:predicted  nucleic acid-binding Zn-ribbon protein